MTADLIRTTFDPTSIVLEPGAEPVTVDVRVFNLATIVETFIVEAPRAPQWMRVRPAEVHLLPSTDETVRLEFSIPEGQFVPAVQSPLEIRVRSVANPSVVRREYIHVTVPPNQAQVGLILEPSVVRIRDRGDGALYVHADNRQSNEPVWLTLSGTDTERVVHFAFTPPTLHIPPGQWGGANVRISAPQPQAGTEATRHLTITATGEGRTAAGSGTFVQETSVRPPIRPIARLALTLGGAMTMIAGAFGPWVAFSPLAGTQWSFVEYAAAIGLRVAPVSAAVPTILISAGLVAIFFGLLAALGLIGAKGRLTRVSAILLALFLTAFLVGLWIGAGSGAPGLGAVVVYLGCVLAFIGSLLIKRT